MGLHHTKVGFKKLIHVAPILISFIWRLNRPEVLPERNQPGQQHGRDSNVHYVPAHGESDGTSHTTTASVLTTFPIFYAICMRKHRIIIGNVVKGARAW